jgi:hypothetical protein
MIKFLFSKIKFNLKHADYSPDSYFIEDYVKNIWLYNNLFLTIFKNAIDKHLINSTNTGSPAPATEINKIPILYHREARINEVRQEWLQYENQKLLFEHIKNAHIEIQQLKKDVSRLSQLFLEQIYNENNFDNNLN